MGEGAKEEELGPPGRVFLTGHLESYPDLRLYTTREFPLLEHVIYRGTREYWSLPLFDLQQNQCFGILEFLGFPIDLRYILEKLKEVKLRSTHVNYHLASMEVVPFFSITCFCVSSLQCIHLNPHFMLYEMLGSLFYYFIVEQIILCYFWEDQLIYMLDGSE